jgi:hypothetical protein
MIDTKVQQLSSLFEILAGELDVPEEIYSDMVRKYQHLGGWIREDSKDKFRADAEIYPQGSVNLGTTIPPLDATCGYDLDLVYRRDLAKSGITQTDLVKQAGDQLNRYIEHLKREGEPVPELIPRRRCWALNYKGHFHMDVLPAIPDDEARIYSLRDYDEAILITDRQLRAWQHSNPKGYANWFFQREEMVLPELRRMAAKAFNVDVADIPIERVRTPLRRAIQLAKRHRDFRYTGDPEDKPVSIIITTLAAKAYSNEEDAFEALANIAQTMRDFISFENGIWQVGNPVNPQENFADKWNERPERAVRFFEWLDALESDLANAQKQSDLNQFAKALSPVFGKELVERSLVKFGRRIDAAHQRGELRMSAKTGALGSTGIVVPKNTWYGEE